MSWLAPLTGFAMVVLAGCTSQAQVRFERAPVPAPMSAGSDACGASKVAAYIGAQPTDEIVAKIKSASGAQALRVIGPDDAMTMDFREDRLTITVDANGRIKTLRCV